MPSGIALIYECFDKWFIQYYHGSSELGLFSIGKICINAVGCVYNIRQSWSLMDSMNSTDGPHTFRLISRLYIGLAIPLVLLLTCLSPWLVSTFTASIYEPSWPIVSILAWQSFFNGAYLIVCPGIWKSEKTYISLILTCVSVLFALHLITCVLALDQLEPLSPLNYIFSVDIVDLFGK